MTTEEIEKCLEGLSPSERTKFERYLNERFRQCSIEKQVESLENGLLRFEATIQDMNGNYYKVRSYKYGNEAYTIEYVNGKPTNVFRIL